MIHPLKSFIARKQNYTKKHFENSKYGKLLAEYKNSAKNNKCFVIGNGPSLTADDLTTLHNNEIPCFASNNILKLFDKTDWRPEYYVCEDILVLKDIQEKISEASLKNKFIPINYHWYDNININDAKYFLQIFSKGIVFSENIADSIICKGTVTTTCIQLAVYMGYKEIYLLGVDHSYSKSTDNSGKIIVDNSVKDYFDDDYAKTMEKKMIPNLEATTQSYQEVKEHCDKIGVKIYNSTRGGKLEVFPRINFDKVFNQE